MFIYNAESNYSRIKKGNLGNIQLYIYFNIPSQTHGRSKFEFGKEVAKLRNSLGFHENINYLLFGKNVGMHNLLSSVF